MSPYKVTITTIRKHFDLFLHGSYVLFLCNILFGSLLTSNFMIYYLKYEFLVNIFLRYVRHEIRRLQEPKEELVNKL